MEGQEDEAGGEASYKGGKDEEAVMKETCSMRYDVRTVTLRGSQLTFSTSGKRVKTIIEIPSFFTERYPKEEGWKFKGANIGINRKGRVFVNLIYECPDKEIEENREGKIVGLDRGVYNIVTTSGGVHYGAKDARRVKRKYSHVRSELQKKGTRSARRRAKAISGREKRSVQDQNHCISKELANTEEDVSVYILEDLSSIVNQPYGWSATGKLARESMGKTLTSKPEGLS